MQHRWSEARRAGTSCDAPSALKTMVGAAPTPLRTWLPYYRSFGPERQNHARYVRYSSLLIPTLLHRYESNLPLNVADDRKVIKRKTARVGTHLKRYQICVGQRKQSGNG